MRNNYNFPRTDFFWFFSIMERTRKGSDLPNKRGVHRASNKNFYTQSYLCSGKTYQTKIMPFLPLCCDSEAVLSKNSPKLECSYWKIFISNTEISIAKSEISVTGAARLLIWRNRMSFFFRRKERRGEISEIEPAQMTGLMWRGLLLRTPVRVWVAKAVKMQSRLAWNNLFANFSTLS